MASQTDIAEHLDISQAWVSKLTRTGVFPKPEGRGEYDLAQCRTAYLRYLRGRVAIKHIERSPDAVQTLGVPDDGHCPICVRRYSDA